MKTAVYAAAAGLLSVATAQSLCAVNCFQSVVTEHPPLSCKEANMYLCFCKGQDLQDYFAQCVYSKCGSGSSEALNFGVGLCKDLGVPISVPPPPPASTEQSSSPAAPTTSSSPAPTPTAAGSTTLSTLSTLSSAGPSAGTTTTAATSESAPVQTHPATTVATTATTLAPSVTPQPSGSKNQTGIQPSTSAVVVNQGVNMNVAPAMIAAVGIGAAVLHLL